MTNSLFELLSAVVSRDNIRRDTEEIHRLEGNESYSNYRASTDYCMRMMEAAGFGQVERRALPADGRTAYLDCIMPQAWETTGRSFLRLEDAGIPDGRRILADSDEDPFCAGIWGAPTPEGGIDREVVDFQRTGWTPAAVRGRIVLMDGYSQAQYRFLCENGAAAVVISDSKGGEEFPDYCRWCNGIGYAGWYHTAEDRRIPVFSVTPRRAAFLRARLAQGAARAHAEARSRIYDGEIYTVSGLMKGASSEEITMIAHMYEPFLPDDAAGGAVICELCRAIQALIAQGKLPPLRKSLRIVLSMERYGFHEYFLGARDRRTLTVFSFDSCCHFAGGGDLPRLRIRQSSMLQTSFLDLYLPALLRRHLPDLPFAVERGNLSDDTFCSDDFFGIPSLWPHSANMRYHHNSGPAFHDADWELAYDVARLMGTLIGVLATADETAFRGIARECAVLAAEELRARAAVIRYELGLGRLDRREAADKLQFQARRLRDQLASIEAYAPGAFEAADTAELDAIAAQAAPPPVSGAPELHDAFARAARIIPKRLVPGTLLSLARVPQPERQGCSLPDLLYLLLDGKRTLYDAAKLYEYEMDKRFTDADFAQFLVEIQYLERYGYVSIKRCSP